MKKTGWKTYAFWIVFTEAVGGLAGWLIRDGVKLYSTSMAKPPLSPPSIVFPIVWVILYALMGVGAARVYAMSEKPFQSRGIRLFLAQLAFNFFWSIIFFNAQNYALAFFWLLAMWVLILLMIIAFRKVDQTAAWLQIPYLIWTTFAAYLNLGVWLLNR